MGAIIGAPALAAAQAGTSGTSGTSGSGATATGQTDTSTSSGTSTSGTSTSGTSTSGTTSTTSGRTNTSSGSDQDSTGTSVSRTSTTGTGTEAGESHWIASGFVGSDFGSRAEGSNVDFGGSVGYLWNNWVGGEFLAGFSPDFQLQTTAPNAFLLNGTRPMVNSYMLNAIGAASLGPDANWQPFISGGFGAITLRSEIGDSSNVAIGAGSAIANTFSPDESRLAGNIGAGLMGFAGNWGVRADIRYFRAINRDVTSITAPITGTGNGTNGGTTNLGIVPGLDFWRANIGVAVRW